MQPPPTRRTYKRTIILINKRFQLRFCLYVCSWLFALSLAYPLIIHELFNVFFKYLATDPNAPSVNQLGELKGQVLWTLVLIQVLVLVILFLLSLFLSHRIAGPLYKLNKTFQEVKNGNLPKQDMRFRQADHFKELATSFNEMIGGIRTILKKNVDSATAAIPRIEAAMEHADREGKQKLQEALVALQEIRERTPL